MMNKVFRSKRKCEGKPTLASTGLATITAYIQAARRQPRHAQCASNLQYSHRATPPRPHQTRISRQCPPPHTRLRSTSEKKRESQTTTRRNQQTGLRGERRGRDEMSVLYGGGPVSRAVYIQQPTERGVTPAEEPLGRVKTPPAQIVPRKRSYGKGGHTKREKEQKEGEQHGSKQVAHRGWS